MAISRATPEDKIQIPASYPASLLYVDESGVVSNGRFFVVAAAKVRRHGQFAQLIRGVRERSGFSEEFRFNRITRAKLPVYFDLIDALAQTNVHFHACVVDRTQYDPFETCGERWQAHADVTAQLLRGSINKRELVSVSMDVISAPAGVHVEDEIRKMVNLSFRNLSIVTAACLDSKSCDGLQVADVFAGAIAFERRRLAGISGAMNSHKAKVVERVKQAFNLAALDGRTPRVNIVTLKGARKSQTPANKRVAGADLSLRAKSR